MSVLITGSSGFLGEIIFNHFVSKFIDVATLGRNGNVDYKVDLSYEIPKLESFNRVIHISGKAHVYPKTKKEENEFFLVNLQGTMNLCKGLEISKNLPEQFVFISTVAVYGLEAGNNIKENAPLLGSTPYAISKIKAEKFLIEWGAKNGIKILILRLPLVVGANPPGNLGKMINAIKNKYFFLIDQGKARKSMVLADDVGSLLTDAPFAEGIYNLTDGYHPSFEELLFAYNKIYNTRGRLSVPKNLAKLLGKVGDYFSFFQLDTDTVEKMINDLTFNDDKARKELNWVPKSVIQELIK